MPEPSPWAATLDRLRPALTVWAEAQTPVWVRAKLDPGDLVQQTMLEGLRMTEKLAGKPDTEVLAYLRRMLTNNAIDAARKYRRPEQQISPEVAAESSLRMADWLAAPDTSPSERAARNEKYDSLATSLARLPDAQRIAVEWRYLHGAKVAEIARLLDRTEGAVMALLHRAVTTLREELNGWNL